jgi:hypothetical protein
MIVYQFVLFDFWSEKKFRNPILYSSPMPRKRRKRKKKEGCKKHLELEEREEKESVRYTQVGREEQLAHRIKRLTAKGVSTGVIAKSLKVTREEVVQVRETELYESIELPPRPIRKKHWVHPIQGREKSRAKYWRYLCITDPYEDPKEWTEQLKYWKENHGLELKGPEKLVRVLYFRRINPKHSPRKVRLLQGGKQFTFPVECLVRNRRQKRFEIVNKK